MLNWKPSQELARLGPNQRLYAEVTIIYPRCENVPCSMVDVTGEMHVSTSKHPETQPWIWKKTIVPHGVCPLNMTSKKVELGLLQQFVHVSMIAVLGNLYVTHLLDNTICSSNMAVETWSSCFMPRGWFFGCKFPPLNGFLYESGFFPESHGFWPSKRRRVR